jgi:hypothetical protein
VKLLSALHLLSHPAASAVLHNAIVKCGDNPLNPCAQAPDGVGPVMTTFLAWTHWLGIAGGTFGFACCGIMMTIGRRNRSHLASEGASGMPWVLGGLSVVALAYGVTIQVLS